MASTADPVPWHTLFGYLLERLYTPVGLTVQTDVEVSTSPPRVDVLLVRRDASFWSEEQLRWLPDGIRQSTATHILIEFKYTESITEDAVIALVGYDVFFRQAQQVKSDQVLDVLISSRTPQEGTLEILGFRATAIPGVYTNHRFTRLTLLVVSQLPAEPYNAVFRAFAFSQQAKQAAVAMIQSETIWPHLSPDLITVMTLLIKLWKLKGDPSMLPTITREDLLELHEDLPVRIASQLSKEEFLHLFDTNPHMQRIGAEIEARGRAEGWAEATSMLHGTIIKVISRRFGLSEAEQESLSDRLRTITDEACLNTLLEVTMQAETFAAFQATLDEMVLKAE